MSEVTRYDHELRGMIERPKGQFILAADYAELKAQLSALAAENAALKVSRQAVVNAFDDAMNEFGMARGETAADYPAPETPATDAYLNSVRVEAVESFAHQQRVKADALPATSHVARRNHQLAAGMAEDFAAKIRSGKDGE